MIISVTFISFADNKTVSEPSNVLFSAGITNEGVDCYFYESAIKVPCTVTVTYQVMSIMGYPIEKTKTIDLGLVDNNGFGLIECKGRISNYLALHPDYGLVDD